MPHLRINFPHEYNNYHTVDTAVTVRSTCFCCELGVGIVIAAHQRVFNATFTLHAPCGVLHTEKPPQRLSSYDVLD